MDVLGLFMRVQQTNNKYSCKVPPGKINRRHIFRCFWWYLFIFAALRHQFTEKYARTRQNLAPDFDRSSLFLFPQMAGLEPGGGGTGRVGVGFFSVEFGCGDGIFFRDTPAFTAVRSSAVPNTFSWGGSGDGPCTICRGVFLSLFFMLRSVQEAFNHLHLQQSTPKAQTQMLLQIMMLNDNQGQIPKVGSQGGTGSAPCSD